MEIICTKQEYLDHVSDYDGVCLACGEWTAGGVEPDAIGYTCESCGADQVMGAEEALLCDRLEIE